MDGIPKQGTPNQIFTAGWFGELGEKAKHIMSPFFAGWFDADYDKTFLHQTTPIFFICGRHKQVSKVSIDYRSFSVLPNFLTQKCSSLYDGERELMQVLSQESINKFGIPVEYYWINGYDAPNDVGVDKVFGESNIKIVMDVWNIMVSYKLSRESRTWSKFGIGASDQITLLVPKASFEFVTGGRYPQTGDIFREVTTGRMFEITDREEGEPTAAYLQSRQYVWELKAVPYMRQEKLSFTDKTRGSQLNKIVDQFDVLDISNDVDVKVEAIKYKPTVNEESQKNPFGTW